MLNNLPIASNFESLPVSNTRRRNRKHANHSSTLAFLLKARIRGIQLIMASPSKPKPTYPTKRKQSTLEAPVSPPARKRVQSTVTRMPLLTSQTYLFDSTDRHLETAVASFFTPTSQKPPQKIIWQERAPNDDSPNSLLVGKYAPADDSVSALNEHESRKKIIAAFDFVSERYDLLCIRHV